MGGSDKPETLHLHALVDMGSNGIRFSISDLSDSTARLIPTVYQLRSGISIYDAQHDGKGNRISIPDATTSAVISALKSFTRTCHAFNVPEENIRILATEATRTAPNSQDFRDQIKATTGLTVELLSKEDEGRIGALGIASSFPAPLSGIVLDLGGGSVQISWVKLEVGKELQRSVTAVSMPFGAAAMMGRLNSGTKPKDLASEITSSFQDALQQLKTPENMLINHGEGLTLYLSGGGFRGWGYSLMDWHHIQPYPIPIINGFKVDAHLFRPRVSKKDSNPITDDIFRISERRASQAPAVSLLISSLLQALPKVSTIHFAQGGVREGSLYSLLPAHIQSEHPLVAATKQYSTQDRDKLTNMIQATIPSNPSGNLPLFIQSSDSRTALISSLTSLLNYHGSCPKDIRPSAAIRSTTTGILASAHGLTHDSRAWLALALLGRWSTPREDLPGTDVKFYDGLSGLLGPEESWWAGYIGRVAAVIGTLFPAGLIDDGAGWNWSAEWRSMGKKGADGLVINVDSIEDESVKKALKRLAKWGKKKKWDDRLVRGYKIEISGLDDDDGDNDDGLAEGDTD